MPVGAVGGVGESVKIWLIQWGYQKIIFKPSWDSGCATALSLFIVDDALVSAIKYVYYENKTIILLFIWLKLLYNK